MSESVSQHSVTFRTVVGEQKFQEMVKAVISRNIDTLNKSKEGMVNSGIPEDHLVYIVRLMDTRVGRAFVHFDDACKMIGEQIQSWSLNGYGTNKEGYECFCMDDRNYGFIKMAIKDSFTYTAYEWFDFLKSSRYSNVAPQTDQMKM